jgi:hypothetical protein
MYKITGNKRMAVLTLFAATILIFAFSAICFAEGGGRFEVHPWSFGLMADTQWTLGDDPNNPGFPLDPEGTNPEWVSAALAEAVEGELIDAGVKFAIQVGD